MKNKPSPIAWFIVAFLVISIIVLLLGQTMAVLNYDFAVKLGLQQGVDEVGEFGVQINRALGLADTYVYLTLMLLSAIGLVVRQKWAISAVTAVFAISMYWAITRLALLYFLKGMPGYNLDPGPEYWISIGCYLIIGTWGLFYMIFRGDTLLASD